MSSGHAHDAWGDRETQIELSELQRRIISGDLGHVGVPVRRAGRNLVPLTGGEIVALASDAERRGINLTYTPVDNGIGPRVKGYVVTLSRM